MHSEEAGVTTGNPSLPIEQGRMAITRRGPPTLTIPQESIVCVEHPCIIKNLDKGIKSLGGRIPITNFLHSNESEKSLPVSLRPDDVLAKCMPSRKVHVNQILLKVMAPKWTGRKRKRGSNGPFLAESEIHNASRTPTVVDTVSDPKAVFRALRDNPEKYSISAVGEIKENHRYRGMPDYQYATSTNSVISRLKATLMTDDLHKIKSFKLDMVKGLPKTEDVGPPPYFTIIKQPYNYSFRQNTYVKTVTDESGAVTTVNITAPAKHIKFYLDPNDEHVPTAPPPELQSETSLEPRMQEWIAKLRAELEKRPMMQRRVYSNMFNGQNDIELKRAAGYVGYTFTSGPFKDVLIRFGVDPRSDPKYRIYQGVAFQIAPESRGAPDDPGAYMKVRKGKREFFGKRQWVPNTHLFDGTKFYKDGKIWQVCDITDPFLKKLMETDEIRTECDMTYSGWYGNGTWSLLRVIMKDKIRALSEFRVPNDDMYETVAKMFPAFVNDENVTTTAPDSSGMLDRSNQAGFPIDTQVALLATHVRAMSMAAFRQQNRYSRGRRRRVVGDAVLTNAGSPAMDPDAPGRSELELDMHEEEEDEALIGYDSDEEEQEQEEGEESEEEDE